MGVNNLFKVVARQHRGWQSNPPPLDRESNAATRLPVPSHPSDNRQANNYKHGSKRYPRHLPPKVAETTHGWIYFRHVTFAVSTVTYHTHITATRLTVGLRWLRVKLLTL